MRRFPAVVTAALLALLIPVRPFRGFVAPGTGQSSPSRRPLTKACEAAAVSAHSPAHDAHAATRVLAGLALGLLLGAVSVPALQAHESAAPNCDRSPRYQYQATLQEFTRASEIRRSERRLKLVQQQLKEHGKVAIDKLCLEGGTGRSL